jgi:hypothetical protein
VSGRNLNWDTEYRDIIRGIPQSLQAIARIKLRLCQDRFSPVFIPFDAIAYDITDSAVKCTTKRNYINSDASLNRSLITCMALENNHEIDSILAAICQISEVPDASNFRKIVRVARKKKVINVRFRGQSTEANSKPLGAV